MPWRVLLGLWVLFFVATACSEFDYGRLSLPPRASGPPPTVYTVRRGDTLFSIAWRYNLDYRRIARWNGVDPPYTIYPTQRLRLRPPVAASQSTARGSHRVTSAAKPQPATKPPLPEPISPPDSEIVWQWPAEGAIARRFHPDGAGMQGIMLQGRLGEPIRAAADGRVVYSGNGLPGYGNLIIVKHSSVYLTAYGYNRELLVHEGEQVHAGEIIARMGFGPAHQPAAHFEIRRNGEPVDPLRYLPPH
ncbi:MAG: peptidoglycan DD-metalloendopeptidase family protein [Nitrococcus sp.]|nr:peptidoglycan DD-metalloendopeptidase family protein [Nitrococcus sp.]